MTSRSGYVGKHENTVRGHVLFRPAISTSGVLMKTIPQNKSYLSINGLYSW